MKDYVNQKALEQIQEKKKRLDQDHANMDEMIKQVKEKCSDREKPSLKVRSVTDK